MKRLTSSLILILLISNFAPLSARPADTGTPGISEADRIYGLSTLWSEVKRNFIYYDKLSFDWDSLYQSNIPRVQAVATDGEYYALLQLMVNALQDGHTNIFPPADIYKQDWKLIPLRTILLEGRVFVRQVGNDTLLAKGIVPGVEIVGIDGIDVHEYARQHILPFISGSTLQWRERIIYNGMLTKGPADGALTVTFKDKKGRTFEETISRKMFDSGSAEVVYKGTPLEEAVDMPFLQYINSFSDRSLMETFKFERLSGDVGYLWVGSFNDFGFNSGFDALYNDIKSTKALIIDLRGNVGGSSGCAEYVLRHLTTQPFRSLEADSRKYIPYHASHLRAEGREVFPPQVIAAFEDREAYTHPVVVLVDRGTHSAAEDFCAIFKGMGRGMLIGTTTAGSTGQPIQFELPGGGSLAICTVHDTYGDGQEYVGTGFKPDIEVSETIDSYFSGKDLARERALQVLRGK